VSLAVSDAPVVGVGWHLSAAVRGEVMRGPRDLDSFLGRFLVLAASAEDERSAREPVELCALGRLGVDDGGAPSVHKELAARVHGAGAHARRDEDALAAVEADASVVVAECLRAGKKVRVFLVLAIARTSLCSLSLRISWSRRV